MRVLVCGSRHCRDAEKVFNTLDEEFFSGNDLTIIHGDARGADTIADIWARVAHYRLGSDFKDIQIEPFPADWKKHGYAAGPIRNKQMLDEGKPDLVIAFLAPNSRGTKNMIEQAEKAEIPVKVINI